MNRADVKKLILMQLHDHEYQPHGAVQPSYTTWSEDHVELAIDAAISAVTNSLEAAGISAATSRKTLCRTIKSDCQTLDLSGDCDNVMDLISIGGKSVSVSDDPGFAKLFSGTVMAATRQGLASFYLTEKPEANSEVVFSCKLSKNDAILGVYSDAVIAYAQFLLFASDTESKEADALATQHYESYKFFVEIQGKAAS